MVCLVVKALCICVSCGAWFACSVSSSSHSVLDDEAR